MAGPIDPIDPIDRLVARQAVADLIGRYCMLFDDQDWDGLAQLWTDDAAFVVEETAFEPREVLVEFLRTCLPSGYQSKHMISPPIVAVADDGCTATARTDVVWLPANFEVTIVARYDDELVLEPDGWKFRRRVEHPMRHVPGAPPMSNDATGVSAPTMKSSG